MSKQTIPAAGTILCGSAALEQLGHEITIRGSRRPAAVASAPGIGRARRLLADIPLPSGVSIELVVEGEELPEAADALIRVGAASPPPDLPAGLVCRAEIPLTTADLTACETSAETVLVIDRRLQRSDTEVGLVLRKIFRRRFGEESACPFEPEFPPHFHFSSLAELRIAAGAAEEIGALLDERGIRTPMILCDRGIVEAGLLTKLLSGLGSETDPRIRDDIPPDSDMELVAGLSRQFLDEGCDALIALGGGSVLDSAKGILIARSAGRGDPAAAEGANILPPPRIPFVAVPTTSGTGSEATRVAVISDHRQKRKRLFVSPYLQPQLAILDPELTVSLPGYLTAMTGMDALTHAVEAFTCLGANPLSDLAAWRAVELISVHLKQAVLHPGEIESRKAMALASSLAGEAFSNAMVGLVHTIGHAVGAVCGAPHGACMAVLLPHVLSFNMPNINGKLGRLMIPLKDRPTWEQTIELLRGESVVSIIRGLNRALHNATDGRHPTRLREIVDAAGNPRVTQNSFAAIAETALGDASLIYNPREARREDIIALLEKAY